MAVLLSRFFLNLRRGHLTENGTTTTTGDGISDMSELNFGSPLTGNLGADPEYGRDINDDSQDIVGPVYARTSRIDSGTDALSGSSTMQPDAPHDFES